MKTHLTFILIALCAVATLAQDQPARKFDATALFQPGMTAMQTARETCTKVPGPQFGECFVQQMQAAGASPSAVAFMRAIHNDGFMRDFKNTGRVDIAFVLYPFAANENQHCLLVNGTPNLIDVDHYEFLPKEDLPKNPQYAALLQKYPNSLSSPATGRARNSSSQRSFPMAASASWFPMFLSTAATRARASARSSWHSISTAPADSSARRSRVPSRSPLRPSNLRTPTS